MKLIGITGPIGSGKSTAASMLEKKGAIIIDADRVAQEVVEPNKPAWQEIVAYFGEDILRPDNTVNRSKLGKVVFNDPEKLAFLNSIVHPLVISEIDRRIKQIKQESDNDKVVVVDVPLLIEAGMHKSCDVTIIVTADRDIRLQRLVERGLPKDDAERRIEAQSGKTGLEEEADIIIKNNATLVELQAEIDKLWERIKHN